MVSTVQRRLRDSDSAVRSACVEAVSAMSSRITNSPFSTILKPLMETLTTEQDPNSQIGSALCLAAAIESAPDPEVEVLRKSVLPKLGKLLKKEGFKGKAALLVMIGSIVGVGGASNRSVLDWLVPFLIGFLGDEDWTVRKAAAEAVAKVALTEEELAVQYKGTCLNCLERRKFDKVKLVRETMKRTLGMWKDVSVATEVLPSTTKSDNEVRPRVPQSSVNIGIRTPHQKKIVPANRSPPSSASCITPIRKANPPKQNDKNSSVVTSRDMGHKESIERKIDCIVLKYEQNGVNESLKPEIKRVLFSDASDDRMQRLVPSKLVCEDDNSDLDALPSCEKGVVSENHQDGEDLSLIRAQLLQIENQQSSLLDLLQKFIGSSQSGIISLQSRVHGLEMAVHEISNDLALNRGSIPLSKSGEDTCCKIPGAEYLSAKLWRRTPGRYSTPPLSSPRAMPTNAALDQNNRVTNYELYSRKRLSHWGGFGINPLADDRFDLKGNLEQHSWGTPKNLAQDARRSIAGNSDGLRSIDTGPCTRKSEL